MRGSSNPRPKQPPRPRQKTETPVGKLDPGVEVALSDVPEDCLKIGNMWHWKGVRNDMPAELIAEVKSKTQDKDGLWMRVTPLGAPEGPLRSQCQNCMTAGGDVYAPLPSSMHRRAVGHLDIPLQVTEESRRNFGVESFSPHAQRGRRGRAVEPAAPLGNANGLWRRWPSRSSGGDKQACGEAQKEFQETRQGDVGKGKMGLDTDISGPSLETSSRSFICQAKKARSSGSSAELCFEQLTLSRGRPLRRAAESAQDSEALPRPVGSADACRGNAPCNARRGGRSADCSTESSAVEVLSTSSSEAEHGPAMTREMVTLAAVVDHLVSGDVLEALNVACQRFKAVEQIASGGLGEIDGTPAEKPALTSQQEVKQETQQNQMRGWSVTSWGPVKGKEKGKPWGKGGKETPSQGTQPRQVEVEQTDPLRPKSAKGGKRSKT